LLDYWRGIVMEEAVTPFELPKIETNLRRQPRFRWHSTAVVGLVIFAIVVITSILAPVIAPYDPTDQVLRARLEPPSASHLLGTDALGRDVFSRILYGGRLALVISFVSVFISATFGTVLGALASRHAGSTIEEIIMRAIDLFLSFPSIIIALMIVVTLKPGFWALVLALTITGWTPYARLARAVGLEILTQTYIEAAAAIGESEFLTMRKHILPNTMGPILAQIFLRFGHTMLMIAGLSYLGIGIQPPTPDWGQMLADAQPYMVRVPTLIIFPGLAIFITTLAVTLAGQGLMLMFDPQQRRTW
jgi:ABC-type dipeptide/oligopeptide/nickel transport system permease subunit